MRDFAIIGYLPSHEARDADAISFARLTDVIVFSVIPQGDGTLDLQHFDAAMVKAMAKRMAHGRVHVCVGGWGRSDGFAPMAADDAARSQFIKNLLALCDEHKLNGVDLDWEFPRDQSQKKHYAQLLKQLNAALKPRKMMLTLAVAGNTSHLPAAAYDAVDRVHIMSYDHADKHATYERAEADIAFWRDEMKLPAAKLILGLPIYARSVENRQQTLTYAQVVRRFAPPPESDQVEHWYFNGPQTIARKTTLARERGLGGVMFWQIGGDTSQEATSLIHAASSAAKEE